MTVLAHLRVWLSGAWKYCAADRVALASSLWELRCRWRFRQARRLCNVFARRPAPVHNGEEAYGGRLILRGLGRLNSLE